MEDFKENPAMSPDTPNEEIPSEWTPGVFNEAARRRALTALNIVNKDPEERFDRITRLAAQLLGTKSSVITLILDDRIFIKSRYGTDIGDLSRKDSLSDFVVRTAEMLEVADASIDPRFKNNSVVTGESHVRFYAGLPLAAQNGELIGTLSVFDPNPRTFTSDERSLLHELRLWVQSEMTAEAEIARAARVQRSLLPKQPLVIEGYDVAGGCAHVQIVGGDFYDWYPVLEGEAFTLADVMGKGMAAAIIAATVRAVLRAGSRDGSIIKAVEVATATLEADLHNAGSFVTLFHARLNTSTGEIRFVDAGHSLSMIYRSDGSSERLTSDNLPLGAGIETTWEEHLTSLGVGDVLVSVSDGVLDLFDGTIGGLNRVENIVRYSQNSQEAVNELIALADHSASDDATILIIRRKS